MRREYEIAFHRSLGHGFMTLTLLFWLIMAMSILFMIAQGRISILWIDYFLVSWLWIITYHQALHWYNSAEDIEAGNVPENLRGWDVSKNKKK